MNSGELGPVYGYQWRSWPAADGRQIDQISDVIERIRAHARFAAADRQRLERGRSRSDGAAAVPFAVSVLCGGGPALVPDVSAERGCVSRRAVQHRVVRPADVDGRPGHAA